MIVAEWAGHEASRKGARVMPPMAVWFNVALGALCFIVARLTWLRGKKQGSRTALAERDVRCPWPVFLVLCRFDDRCRGCERNLVRAGGRSGSAGDGFHLRRSA